MSGKNGYVKLDGEALSDFKTDFNSLLTQTIRIMIAKSVEEADVTAKLKIRLTAEGGPNLYAKDSPKEQGRVIPEFEHKVTASMKMKSELSGEAGGLEYELRYDAKADAFVMEYAQETLFEGETQ